MECLTDLVLFFALLPVPSGVPVLTIILYLIWISRHIRPCFYCVVVLYILFVVILLSPLERDGTGYGLFDFLRISPESVELNLLLRLSYGRSMMVSKSPVSGEYVLEPEGKFLDFFCSLLRYLIEPNYGKIIRI